MNQYFWKEAQKECNNVKKKKKKTRRKFAIDDTPLGNGWGKTLELQLLPRQIDMLDNKGKGLLEYGAIDGELTQSRTHQDLI